MKGAIYDLDDLIINSHYISKDAWKTLEKYNCSDEGADLTQDFKARLIGLRITDTIERIAEYRKLNVDAEKLAKEREKKVMELLKNGGEPMPGLRYSLELFRENSFRIALASSGFREYIEAVLDKFEINDYFEVIVSGDEVTKGKPNPEPYILASKKLELEPKECIVLEDAKNGVQSAKAAGCKCIGIDSPYTPKQDLSEADIQLNSLEELTLELISS